MDSTLAFDTADWQRSGPTPEQVRTDAALAIALFFGSVLSMTLWRLSGMYDHSADPLPSLLLLGWVTLPLALRRRYPSACLLVVTIGFTVAATLAVPENLMSNIALFLAFYSVGAWERDRHRAFWVRIVVVCGMFIWLIVTLYQMSTDTEALKVLSVDSVGWGLSPMVAYMFIQFLTNVVYFSGAYWFGDKSWGSARDRDRLAHLARQVAAQQHQAERQAVALERMRIARELHDVVAHNLALIGVQAGAARMTIDREISATAAALEIIEDSSRDAVGELRTLLHALREDSDESTDDTQALIGLGLERLDELINNATDAGLQVAYSQVGESQRVPPLASLTLYRAVQEALTNILRHAGPGTATDVRLRFGKGWVEIEVSNGKPPQRLRRSQGGSALGLVGMRERVEAGGGTLEAHHLSQGGFVVRARLPLPAAEME